MRSVDFPEPFAPMTPNVSPRRTSNVTSESAGDRLRRLERLPEAPAEERRLQRPEGAGPAPAPVDLREVARLDGDGRARAHTASGKESRRRSKKAHPIAKATIEIPAAARPRRRRREPAVEERVVPAGEEGREGVQREEAGQPSPSGGPSACRGSASRRRGRERTVCEEVLHVAEVDRQRGEEEADAEEEDAPRGAGGAAPGRAATRAGPRGPKAPKAPARSAARRTGSARRKWTPCAEDGDGRQDLRREEDLPEERAVRQERGGRVGDRRREPVPGEEAAEEEEGVRGRRRAPVREEELEDEGVDRQHQERIQERPEEARGRSRDSAPSPPAPRGRRRAPGGARGREAAPFRSPMIRGAARVRPIPPERDRRSVGAWARESSSRVSARPGARSGGGRGRRLGGARRRLVLPRARRSSSALLGPSGCGKSTLLNLLGALDRPTSGRVLVDGHDLALLSEAERDLYRRRTAATVFQFFNLLPTMTSLENVALPLLLDGVPPAEADERAAAALGEVGLPEKSGAFPWQLSGGQMQRVAVARALVARPVAPPRRRADREPRLALRGAGPRPRLGPRRGARRDDRPGDALRRRGGPGDARPAPPRRPPRSVSRVAPLFGPLLFRPLAERPAALRPHRRRDRRRRRDDGRDPPRERLGPLRPSPRRSTSSPGRLDLTVLADGPGIPEETLERLSWLRARGVTRRPGRRRDGRLQARQTATSSRSSASTRSPTPRSGTTRFASRLDAEEATLGRLFAIFQRNSVLVPAPLAERLGLTEGSELGVFAGGAVRRLRVAGHPPARRGRPRGRRVDRLRGHRHGAGGCSAGKGCLDRIDLVLPEGLGDADRAALEESVRDSLPPGVTVGRPERRTETVDRMVRSFRVNLTALGLIALLVGIYFVYSTLSISVLRRRSDIGTVRALGASSRSVFLVFLAEGAALGVLGSAPRPRSRRRPGEGRARRRRRDGDGLLPSPGRPVARPRAAGPRHRLPRRPRRPRSSPPSRPPSRPRRVDPAVDVPARLRRGLAAPGREAARDRRARSSSSSPPSPRVPGRSAAFRSSASRRSSSSSPASRSSPPSPSRRSRGTPTGVAVRLLGVEARIARANLTGSLSRTAVAVAALSMGISMMVAVAVMVGSFRATVVDWVSQTLEGRPLRRARGRAVAARARAAARGGRHAAWSESPASPPSTPSSRSRRRGTESPSPSGRAASPSSRRTETCRWPTGATRATVLARALSHGARRSSPSPTP